MSVTVLAGIAAVGVVVLLVLMSGSGGASPRDGS